VERRVELIAALAATIFGLTGVVTEAQALADPALHPELSWVFGMGRGAAASGDAMANIQHALLPMAVLFVLVAVGAYLHAVHEQWMGLGLLLTSSIAVIVATAFAVFNATYAAVLLLPAPLIVLTAVLAASASVCAISSAGLRVSLSHRNVLRGARFRQIRPRSTT
jgi:hypothetical protein